MPIRMVDDPDDQPSYQDDNRGGGGGTGGGGFNPLMLLLLLFRGGKSSLLLLLVLGGAFLFLNKGGCNFLSSVDNSRAQQLATGGVLNPREFGKASVYEALEADDIKNPLPENISLLAYAPQRLNQGEQGSCVAWSSAYAAHSIAEAVKSKTEGANVAFSPSFMYNQIGLQGCQGSYIIRAMELMQKQGSVPFNAFPYNDKDCRSQPDNSLKANASQFRIHGYNRLTDGEGTNNINIRAIKEHLAKEAPVVIGMMVGQSFMQPMMGQDLWQPAAGDNSMMGMGGHAMCVIGYDDRKYGGAFQIMNSWGPEWGNNGVAWVRYGDFKRFVREAYGIDPLPKQSQSRVETVQLQVGLVNTASKQYIQLEGRGDAFQTQTPIKKGTTFKIEVKNNEPCYVYVFGQEVDGSVYTLFPYPSSSSPSQSRFTPYCGITGYRLFPRGMSMMADSIGNRDFMMVVASRDSLNWFQLNKSMNQMRGNNLVEKYRLVVKENAGIGGVTSIASNGTIQLQINGNGQPSTAVMIAIDKQ